MGADGMNEIVQMQMRNAKRFEFDQTLARLQELLLEIHRFGGKDVIAYRVDGGMAEIYRERND